MPDATSLFRRKPIDELVDREASDKSGLKRTLGAPGLMALGIGAIIGAGLFSLTGIAAAENAGPAVALSFVIAGIGCGFTALCYSELASTIPVAGSAYTYAYATMGELIAWIIGWDLALEYAVGAGTVAVSWSRYVGSLLHDWGVALPHALTASPFEGGIANVPGMLIVVACSLLLMRGLSESARVNAVIVVVKVAIVIAVIGFGAGYVKTANWHPFIPPNAGSFGHFGISGVLRGAGVIFFAYIGFDAVSTTAQETRNPQRDMPIGILGALLICTVLYVGFALVLTGLVPYHDMQGDAAPVATAIDKTPFHWLQLAVKLGIIGGFTTVILVGLLGQSRVFYAMAQDGMIPALFGRLHPTRKTPWLGHLVFMVPTATLAGFVPITTLGHMTSIGTLLAFALVCGGVILLRRTDPDLPRAFRVPYSPVVPVLGICVCLVMMASLDALTWLRLGGWMVIGIGVYLGYSRRNSRAARETARAEAPS